MPRPRIRARRMVALPLTGVSIRSATTDHTRTPRREKLALQALSALSPEESRKLRKTACQGTIGGFRMSGVSSEARQRRDRSSRSVKERVHATWIWLQLHG